MEMNRERSGRAAWVAHRGEEETEDDCKGKRKKKTNSLLLERMTKTNLKGIIRKITKLIHLTSEG